MVRELCPVVVVAVDGTITQCCYIRAAAAADRRRGPQFPLLIVYFYYCLNLDLQESLPTKKQTIPRSSKNVSNS
jgi:hypothetical protein